MDFKTSAHRTPRGSPLSDEQRSRLHAYVQRFGEEAAIHHFGISRNALYRSLAGLTILNGTAALVGAGLNSTVSP
jgi:hypothetical protein